MRKPNITIRKGAAHNEVTVDGATFDLSVMTRRERTYLRKVVVGGLEKVGYFEKGVGQ